AMPRVRRAHLARPLSPVERQRVGADALAPERLLEARAQRLRAAGVFLRAAGVLAPGCEHRGRAPRGVRIALHLAQRDRVLGPLPVRVPDRVRRILPALLEEPAIGAAR